MYFMLFCKDKRALGGAEGHPNENGGRCSFHCNQGRQENPYHLSVSYHQLPLVHVIHLDSRQNLTFSKVCLCFLSPASLLKGLKHANIVLLHDIIHTRESLTFVFEYMVSSIHCRVHLLLKVLTSR